MFLESYWSAVGRVDHRKLSLESSCPLTRLEFIRHIVIKASFVFLILFDQEPRFRRNKMQQEYTFTSSTILLLQRKQLYEKFCVFGVWSGQTAYRSASSIQREFARKTNYMSTFVSFASIRFIAKLVENTTEQVARDYSWFCNCIGVKRESQLVKNCRSVK